MKKAFVIVLVAAGIGVGVSLIAFRQGDTKGMLGQATSQSKDLTGTTTPAASESAINEEIPMQTQTPTATQTTSPKPKIYSAPPAMTIEVNKTYVATIKTFKGVIKVTLFAKDTPITVNNFVFLAREGFYDNTTFHRIIKGFMIQGGDPKGDGTGSPGYRFNDEPVTRNYTRGTIAMANAGPNTNGSQFFIMHADYALPKNYVIFGAIDPTDAESLKTLDAIANTPVADNGMGEQSRPTEQIVVSSVTIEEK